MYRSRKTRGSLSDGRGVVSYILLGGDPHPCCLKAFHVWPVGEVGPTSFTTPPTLYSVRKLKKLTRSLE